MINLTEKQKINEDGTSKILIYDEYDFPYRELEELRGANNKFWLVNNLAQSDVLGTFLFKCSNRRNEGNRPNGKSYGEILSQNVARELGLPYVVYLYSCIKRLDGTTFYGTVCPNYKHNMQDIEISGYDLTEKYMSLIDEGKVQDDNVQLNTIYEYLKELKTVFAECVQETEIESMRQTLLKYALFDFCTCQTDRHWKNMGFLVSKEEEKINVDVLPLYDNEKCFLANKTLSWLEKYESDIFKVKKGANSIVEPVVNAVDRVPRLGIRTSTTVNCGHDVLIANKIENGSGETPIQVFTRELAGEIHENPELRNFYLQMKKLDIEKAVDSEDVPNYMKTVAVKIWEERVSQLDRVYEKNFGPLEGNKIEEGNELDES